MFEAVFLLITGTILIALNYKAIKREKNSFSKAMQDENLNLNNYDIEIGKLKTEFSEDIAKLQIEIANLKETKMEFPLLNSRENEQSVEVLKDKPVEEQIEEPVKKQARKPRKKSAEKPAEENNAANNVKISEIKDLMDQNVPIDEIAQKLNIGKGELQLIKDLYIK